MIPTSQDTERRREGRHVDLCLETQSGMKRDAAAEEQRRRSRRREGPRGTAEKTQREDAGIFKEKMEADRRRRRSETPICGKTGRDAEETQKNRETQRRRGRLRNT